MPAFAQQMLAALAAGARIDTGDGQIVFEPTPEKIDVLRRPADPQVFWLSAEQSNSSLIVDDAVMLKIFRRIAPGQHPEAEMGRYLTAQGFANAPLLLGEIVRIDADGERHSLAVAQSFVRNQGDAWTWTLNQFNRALGDLATREASADARDDNVEDYLSLAGTIGRQLGVMHSILARPTDEEAFAPRRAGPDDVTEWIRRVNDLVEKALVAIGQRASWESETAEAEARDLMAARTKLTAAMRKLGETGKGTLMTRIHGDFHLGQVLVASADAYIIDFEGEPARPLVERRGKASPLRDVAGLLRSIDYAAATTLDPKNLAAAGLPDSRRRKFVTRLRESAERAFLSAYREVTDGQVDLGGPDLLDFFLIEKAAYEIGYEAANRPTWLPVPVGGLARLASRVLGPAWGTGS